MSTCCDIAQSSTSSDLILDYPAVAHSIVELDDGPPKVLAFRSFQSAQPIRNVRESKPFRVAFGNSFLARSYQTKKFS
jgi:hypothetical protein